MNKGDLILNNKGKNSVKFFSLRFPELASPYKNAGEKNSEYFFSLRFPKHTPPLKTAREQVTEEFFNLNYPELNILYDE